MNRIDRLSAILIQLQSRRVVKAQDIADRFAISLRTVYRDVKALEEAGIPVIGEAGAGYSLADGYRLPPVMFTREEAMAFVTAEKLVESLTDKVNGTHYQSAMFKIKSVLRNAEKDYLASVDDRISVLKSRSNKHAEPEVNPMQIILTAIAERKVLKLKYFTYYRQQHTERHVEPVGTFYLDNFWHFIAYCRTRQDYRDFRFDRMTDLAITQDCFDSHHPTLKEYLDQVYVDRKLESVVLRVNKKAALRLGEQKYYHGYIDEVDKGDEVEMSFMTMSLMGFARWYLMFADCASIIKPIALKEQVKSIIENINLS
ncbi:YafY family transcriptional regulator [Mucilaginibacter sp. Bleaf8]|uniref:helix-turn-helix transcriptional regulator n=1 Tax=Mucilaginibacter sp. Bleaf8 TaxID=2834430 RepID=UPI001BCD56B9|nr:YafY family protein [Mucilaginibacter sp. Bleaf8]MBS7564967.1 YafY family transcriptional regulator [Mucilaginibacter sp. Bleaf8]